MIQIENPSKPYALASTYRRDTWPTLASARESYKSSKFYQKWDARVLDKWIQHGLQEAIPDSTSASKDRSEQSQVSLVTSPAQEVFTFLRPAYHDDRMLQEQEHVSLMEQDMHPEDIDESYPFYRPEPSMIARRLPELKPSVMYVFGSTSDLSRPEERQRKTSSTGSGLGGSGGVKKGRVKEVVLDCGHLVPMERVHQTAVAIGDFLSVELDRWSDVQADRSRRWNNLSEAARVGINDTWKAHIGPPPARKPRGNGDGKSSGTGSEGKG